MSVADNLVLRPLKAADVKRIFSDWLKSYRKEPELKNVSNPVYFHWHHRCIESLMVDPSVVWAVAVPSDNPDLICGWACAQEFAGGALLVHYLYVTKNYRRFGLASRLLATLGLAKDSGVMVSSRTFGGEALFKARGNTVVYNPYLLLGRAPTPSIPGEPRADIVKAIAASAKAFRTGFNINETPEERS